MREFYNILKQNIIINKAVIKGYSIISVAFFAVMFLFFSRDFAEASDVVVILDMRFIMLFLLVSYPLVANIIFDDKRLITSRVLSKKSTKSYLAKLLLSVLVTYIYPVIYYTLKFLLWKIFSSEGDYIDSYIIIGMMMICSISFILFLLFQYYMNIIRFKEKSKKHRMIPIILIIVFITFYIILGVLFDAYIFDQYRGTTQYWDYLNLFENITYVFAGILFLIFMRYQVKLYGKVNV